MAVSTEVCGLAERVDGSAFAAGNVQEETRRTGHTTSTGLVKFLAVGVLESNHALTAAKTVAGETGGTGAVDNVGGLTERVEVFAPSFTLAEEIT